MTEALKRIEDLKLSPLFNLSLGSKELFHSNFIHWLANTYPAEVGIIFSRYLQNTPKAELLKVKSFREKENIDLRLVFADGQVLIIENKVKSIPYIEQLEQYGVEQTRDKKTGSKKSFMLLSLSRPSFAPEDKFVVSGIAWHFLDYEGFAKLLGNFLSRITNPYHISILQDYIEFAVRLQDVSRLADINFSTDKFDFNAGEIFSELKEIRLIDFYLKKKYALIAGELYRRVEEKFPGQVRRGSWTTERHEPHAMAGSIFITSDMTRGQGLVELMYTVKSGLAIGVQIQGDEYRKFVINKEHGKDIAKKLRSEKSWFDFSHIAHDEEYPKRAGKEFKSYNDEFYYRAVRLPNNLTVGQVIDLVMEDTLRASQITT
jgi:hypothetical protein